MRRDRLNRLRLCWPLLLFASSAWGQATALKELPTPVGREVDFRKDVEPILAKSCHACHGPEKQEGGLRLHRRADAFIGGDNGRAFEAGKSAESRLIKYVSGLNDDRILMPPEGDGERLSADQIAVLRAWIDQGAKWPEDGGSTSPEKLHWSFQPVKRPVPPDVKNSAWIKSGIDAFGARQSGKSRLVAVSRGRSGDVDPAAEFRPAGPAADAGRSGCICQRHAARCL
jgi:hypothetical protein